MAQTGYTPIVLYASGTATNTPIAGNLASGELAINYADGKLFYKDSSGVVQVLATKDATSGSFTNLAYTGTLTGGTGVVNLGSGQFYKDASGNVGIGTTPPSGSTTPSIFLGATTNVFGSNTAVASFGANAYQGSLGWTYASTATAALYSQNTATHAWYTASSGTANTAITWAERMRIDSSGNVGIGTSSPANRLEVNSNARITGSTIAGANFYLNNTQGTSFKSQITWLASGSAKYSIGLDPAGNGTNNFYFYDEVAGSQRMTIDSTGNVGIGTSSPVTGLSVSKSSGFIQLTDGTIDYRSFVWTGSAAAATGTWSNHPLLFNTANAERMRIDSSGKVLIGGTTSVYGGGSGRGALEVNGSADSLLAYTIAGSTTNSTYCYNTSTSFETNVVGSRYCYWTVNGSERMRIDSDGNLLVGGTTLTATPTSGHVFGLAATSAYHAIGHATGTPSGNYYATFNYASGLIGSITQSGTTAVLFNVTSDQRLKENIQDAESASTLIDALQVRQFDWKTDNTHQRYGFIAQELVTVAPEAVHQPVNKAEMMAVDYSKLVPMLVKEIQSLRKRVAQLESK